MYQEITGTSRTELITNVAAFLVANPTFLVLTI